jgi:hypothetical protein
MIATRVYEAIGWLVWRGMKMLAKRQFRENQAKIAAAGVIAVVIAGGVAAARSSSE